MPRPTLEELEDPSLRKRWIDFQIEEIQWKLKLEAAKRRLAGYNDAEDAWLSLL